MRGVTRLGMDAAPFIYFVENHPLFHALVEPFFWAIGAGTVQAGVSTLGYTETLVMPLRNNDAALLNIYQNLLSSAQGVRDVPVSVALTTRAADLRGRYNLRTPDAVHLATVIDAGCDAFLTNCDALKRVAEINVIVLKNLTL